MAVMTISNHVLVAIDMEYTYPDWVCIERIIWITDGQLHLGTDLLEINDKNGKSVLEPIRLGDAGVDREVDMHSKWARGLHVKQMPQYCALNIYLRQEPKR